MSRKCVNKTISIPPETIRLIKMAARITGVSFSEFLRQAAIEKMERLSLISTILKQEAAKDVEG